MAHETYDEMLFRKADEAMGAPRPAGDYEAFVMRPIPLAGYVPDLMDEMELTVDCGIEDGTVYQAMVTAESYYKVSEDLKIAAWVTEKVKPYEISLTQTEIEGIIESFEIKASEDYEDRKAEGRCRCED